MKELFFGTTNEAKIRQIQSALSPAGIKVEGAMIGTLPDVEEDGKTVVENARKKALIYASYLNKAVFSMDNGLYLDDLPLNQQPGLHVRRIPGSGDRPSDEELISYYSQLIFTLGNRINGHWEYGLCIATPSGNYQETLLTSPRIFISNPSSNREPGYPLESMQIEPSTGKLIADMSQEEKELFWQKEIGQPLLQFILSVKL